MNRLHALACELVAGGLPQRLSAARAAKTLRAIRPLDAVDVECKRIAEDVLVDIRRIDAQLKAVKARIGFAVTGAGTSVTTIYGVGPVVAAILCGQTGHISRFPSADGDARYNGSAPVEASSGPGRVGIESYLEISPSPSPRRNDASGRARLVWRAQ